VDSGRGDRGRTYACSPEPCINKIEGGGGKKKEFLFAKDTPGKNQDGGGDTTKREEEDAEHSLQKRRSCRAIEPDSIERQKLGKGEVVSGKEMGNRPMGSKSNLCPKRGAAHKQNGKKGDRLSQKTKMF